MGFILIQMEVDMKGNLKMIKRKDLEYINILKEKFILEILKMI